MNGYAVIRNWFLEHVVTLTPREPQTFFYVTTHRVSEAIGADIEQATLDGFDVARI